MKQGIYIGVMTGTSLDAIDLVLAEFNRKGGISQLYFEEVAFSEEIRNFLKSITTVLSLKSLSQLNIRYTNEVATAVNNFIKKNNFLPEQIRAIGFHGQTIWHQPDEEIFLGQNIRSTYQIGSGTHLATMTKIDVVYDFRTSDMTLGGQGAPLIPIFDYNYLQEKEKDVIVLNIGGIANITYLKANGSKSDVIAFDTGPGNCLIDLLMSKYFKLDFDKDGLYARKGNLDLETLDRLMRHEYISRQYPKSTGKELFNLAFLEKNGVLKLTPKDALATVTHFTAQSIAQNIEMITSSKFILKVAGGGAKNQFLMELLNTNIPKAKVKNTILDGKDITDSREALLMSFLAFQRINEIPANMPSVTGAKREILLGSIAKGSIDS
ncbi:anhydro-N-acetylmuramic acid kinase [bacterium]|nr:MAG: anhydro-N-acetylmuramic acid kinase [bacterium]